MNLIGIEKLVYGVEDLDQCKRFWRDFGLSVSEDDDYAELEDQIP